MSLDGVHGFLDVESAALRAPQVGIANSAPQHILSVGSNLYVSGDSSDVLTVDGNVVCEGVKVGLIEIIPSYDLEAVANVGNVTQSTIQFTNPGTGIVTTGNVTVGKELNVTGNVQIRGTTFIKANTNNDNLAIGTEAGQIEQSSNCVAVGHEAGNSGQGFSSVAVGNQAGLTSQGSQAVAMGREAGQTTQGTNAIAVGTSAGATTQGSSAIALGPLAGVTNQGSQATAVGDQAGQTSQGNQAVAIGFGAGYINQGSSAIALGPLAGVTSQGVNAIAVGTSAGQTSQGVDAIAVGTSAGQTSQGLYAVAVGYKAGLTNQHDNSIILNATGTALNSVGASRFYVKPIRAAAVASNVVTYNATTGEVLNSSIAADASGHVGIGGAADANNELKVTGSILATQDILAFSDRRLKSNIERIEGALDKVCALGGYTFMMNDKPSTGLIAQEVLEVLPEAVHGSEETHYSLAYGNMIGLLVEAVKELRALI